tara:strand:+ start:234 stop:677 length:444 start_codon:yes stop_codon:yes gene_type:complete
MPIKSFRGKLADGAIETVSLHTNTGSTGYRIVKLNLFAAKPGTASQESVVKIYKIPQTTADGEVDFSDNTMIAAGYLLNHVTATDNPAYMYTLFDNEIFNQDIYITHSEVKNSEEINYYIELEAMPLSLDENTVATLKDIRNIKSNE